MTDRTSVSNRAGRMIGAVTLAAGGLLLTLAVMGSGLRAADEPAAGKSPAADKSPAPGKSETKPAEATATTEGTGATPGKSGENPRPAPKPNAAKRDPKRPEQKRGATFAERSQAVIAFAREHHPELAELLTRLEMTDAKQFETAIHELEREVERLTRMKEKPTAQYDLAIKKWKYDSRIRLIVARLSMNESSELEAELRSAVSERVALREQELRDELVQLRKRIESHEKQLKEIDESRDKVIDREVSLMRKSAGAARDRLKKQQAAARKATEKTTGKAEAKSGNSAKRETATGDKNKKPVPGKSTPEAVRADADSKETTGKDSGT